MVEINPPDFVSSACYTFADFRRVNGSIVCVDGVVDYFGGDLKVTAAGGASIDVSVAAGDAWVSGDLNNAVGAYLVTNSAAKSVTIAANGAGSARIDLIIACVYDSEYIGAVDQWAIEVVQGVAGGGTPAVPTGTKAGYIILGSVSVPASGGTPSVVTDVRTAMSTCGTAPYVALTSSGDTTLTNAVGTKMVLATQTHLDGDFFTVASSVVTVTFTGLYNITSSLFLNTTAGLYVYWGVSVRKNGVAGSAVLIAYGDLQAVDDLGDTRTQLKVPLTAGDTLQLVGLQSSGGNRGATGSLLIEKVG